jgi:hypothetical protein
MTIAKHAITIINVFSEAVYQPPNPPTGKTTYSRTVFKNCQWEDITDRQANNNGITQINKLISVIIPKTKGMKPYKKNEDYAKLPIDQKPNCWTLAAEGEIFLGEVPEITALYTIETAKKDFRHCMIKGIDDLSDTPVLPHWEVTGI